MKRIFIASTQPEDWKRLLADPEKHWRTGFSAKSLAHCWEDTDDFPQEITRLFAESNIPAFQGIEVLLILPTKKQPTSEGDFRETWQRKGRVRTLILAQSRL